MAERRVKYSKEEKLELLCLIDELGSLAAVEKSTGVARATLRKWGDELSTEIVQYKAIKKGEAKTPLKLATSIEAQTLCNHASFLSEASRIKKAALEKLETLITSSKNLKDVCTALELLHSITEDKPGGEIGDNKMGAYQQILNLQINNNYDKAGN